MPRIKKDISLAATLFVAIFAATAAYAGASPFQYNPEFIGNVLCGGSGSCALPTLLQNLYRYLVVGGLIAAVLFIVLAGLEYILSEIPYVQREAKDKMVQVLIGVLLLLSVGFILGIFGISPVVKIDLPFNPVSGFSLGVSGGGPVPGSCSVGTGLCSPDSLRAYFPTDAVARTASIICQKESGGNPFTLNRGCTFGLTADYSVGLFQINLLPSNRCPGAFSAYSVNPPSCTIADQSILDQCVNALQDPDTNIKKAVQMSGDGADWSPWAAARACGI